MQKEKSHTAAETVTESVNKLAPFKSSVNFNREGFDGIPPLPAWAPKYADQKGKWVIKAYQY